MLSTNEDRMKPATPMMLPLKDIDWGGLVSAIGTANRALAHYDGVLCGVPNPQVLLSPLTTQEAVLSSRIEGTRATLDDVLKFEAGADVTEEATRQDIQEIINYRRALLAAEKALKRRPFTLTLLRQLHEILLNSVRGRHMARGRFRTSQNFIGAPGATIQQALYIPPEPSRVPAYMDNWEKYYHADERDPLVHLALLHAQFERIHPFLDGNGRLGRILVPIFLYERQLLARPMFYLSAYLESHREEYVGLLRGLDGPETWSPWIAFFLRALAEQARENATIARRILALYERLKGEILALTHSQFAVPLLDRLFRQPVFASSTLVTDKAMPSKPMVMALLRKLREAGMLVVVREGSGRRAQILALGELVNLCEGKRAF
jgi:Fic family protein